MQQYKIWTTFFVFRIFRKMAKTTIKPNKRSPSITSFFSGFSKLSPFKQAKKQSVEEIAFKFNMEKLKEKQEEEKKNKQVALNKKELHEVALKEIAYYLTLLKIPDDQALPILVKLFREYEVESKLVKTIFFTHRQYTQAILATRVDSAVNRNRDKEAFSRFSGISLVLLKMLEFLDGDSAYFELLILNRRIRDDIKVELYGKFMMKNPQISKDLRLKIHYLMIPDKYRVRLFVLKLLRMFKSPKYLKSKF